MSYSVNWVTKLITIPLSDLTLVSGSNYTLAVADVHDEIRRLEWEQSGGLWAPYILNHYPTVTLSGIPKTRTVEMVNGYTWNVDSTNINISLIGIDSNLLDTYIPGNGISLLANNSVGKQDVAALGSSEDIRAAVWDSPESANLLGMGKKLKKLLERNIFLGSED